MSPSSDHQHTVHAHGQQQVTSNDRAHAHGQQHITRTLSIMRAHGQQHRAIDFPEIGML